MRPKYTFLIFIISLSSIYAQGGYYYSRYADLPDTAVTAGMPSLLIPVNREDVKAIGMGKTQVANGRTFNAMMYNPAVLARKRTLIEALSVQASLPPQTYDAARFLQNHKSEFRNALSLKEVWQGVKEFNAATNEIQYLNAIRKIQEGLLFPHQLLNEVIGTSASPKTHGVKFIPSISMQFGNVGFSLYGVAQSGFEVHQSPVVDALLDIPIPENIDVNDPQNLEQLQATVRGIEALMQSIVDNQGNPDQEALPVTYAISYIDIVGALGYGYSPAKNLDLGINLKVVHRRFSTKRIAIDSTDLENGNDAYDNITREVLKDFESYITGFTFDLGAIYTFASGTKVGLSLENIIPIQTITSTVRMNVALSYDDYDRDQFGRKIVNFQGDTALVNYSRTVNLRMPFNLKVPFLMNIGATHPITRDWDVSFDLVDVAEQDSRFEKYSERIRIGTEYRFNFMNNLGITPRIGMADNHLTLGLGLNIFRAFQADAAYAYDNYVRDNAYFVQVRFGW